jgi:hypothetical protein
VLVCQDKFVVEKIIIQDKQIVALAIYNSTKGCRAYVGEKGKQW